MWADAQKRANVIAAQTNIGGALCDSLHHVAVWLTPAAGVPYSNAVNIGERKTWTQTELCTWLNSTRGKSLRKCLQNVPAQETAKHRVKFGWLPVNDVAVVKKPRRETVEICWGARTGKPISAVSGPTYTITACTVVQAVV